MDAPPIQYAHTEDGVNIAYWTLGEGPPLLILHVPMGGHVEEEWALGPFRKMYERLAQSYMVIRLDFRGSGLSQGGGSLSARSFALDAIAVLDRVCAGPAFVWAYIGHVAPTVLEVANSRPDLLQGIVFSLPSLTSAVRDGDVVVQAVRALEAFDQHAGAVLRTRNLYPGVSLSDQQEIAANIERTLANLGTGVREAFSSWDVTRQATSLAVPAVVAVSVGGSLEAQQAAREFASIVGAPIVRSEHPLGDSGADELSTQLRLLGGSHRTGQMGTAFRTLLFTDLESSTALTQSLGDAKAQEVLRGHNDAVRTALEAHGGEEVKHTGDGIFAAFRSAVSAVKAALQIQRDLEGGEVRVRIGLNAGEPIQEDDDYFGSAVQLAARVCDRAEPGQVLVPQVVRDLCRGKAFTFEDRGEATLKGFPEPMRLFVVEEGAT